MSKRREMRFKEFIIVLAMIAVAVLGVAERAKRVSPEQVTRVAEESETSPPTPLVKNWSVHGVSAYDPIDRLLKTLGPPLRDSTISSHRDTILEAANGSKIHRRQSLLYRQVEVSGSQLELDGLVVAKEGESQSSVERTLGPPRAKRADCFHYNGAQVYVKDGVVTSVSVDNGPGKAP